MVVIPETYLMVVILETRHAHWSWYLLFNYKVADTSHKLIFINDKVADTSHKLIFINYKVADTSHKLIFIMFNLQ